MLGRWRADRRLLSVHGLFCEMGMSERKMHGEAHYLTCQSENCDFAPCVGRRELEQKLKQAMAERDAMGGFMIEHFNVWFFGNGGYEFMGGSIECILLIAILGFVGGYLSTKLP